MTYYELPEHALATEIAMAFEELTAVGGARQSLRSWRCKRKPGITTGGPVLSALGFQSSRLSMSPTLRELRRTPQVSTRSV